MRWLLLIVVAALGCKDSPKQRARDTASAKEFWPEAPKPTSKAGPRLFRYQPANLPSYQMTASGGTPQGSKVSLSFDMRLDLKLAAGKTPQERDVSIGLLDLDMRGVATMKMRIDDKGLFLDAGDGDAQTWKRGDAAPFDVAAMVDTPFSTLVFEDGRRVAVRTIDSHPFAALEMGDMLDSGLVLFPDLPEEAVAPGTSWKVSRNTPMGASGARTDVTYEMTYTGDGPCPSGAKSCALIELVASSKDVKTSALTATFGFAGKIYFDTERGALDESRVRMDMDGKAAPGGITIGATYIVKPLR